GRFAERGVAGAAERDLVRLRVARGREAGHRHGAHGVAGYRGGVAAGVRRGPGAWLACGDGRVDGAEAVRRQGQARGEAVHGAEREDATKSDDEYALHDGEPSSCNVEERSSKAPCACVTIADAESAPKSPA